MKRWMFLLAGFALASNMAWGNGITVTNVTLINTDKGLGTTDVQFDISWSNSWRASWDEDGIGTNWDAAWVFVKFRASGGDWYHAWLTPSEHWAPTGSEIAVGTNGGGTNVGAFIYRSADGQGPLNLSGVRLCWNYAANGVPRTNQIDVSVQAIEMVYVPQGSFYVGSGGEESGSFTDGAWTSGTTFPFRITSEAALTISNSAGCLWGTSTSGNNTIGDAGVLSNAFPKGFGAFYCMKYEITQGQYRDFLNMLTRAQQNTRTASQAADYFAMSANASIQYRNGIRCPSIIPSVPDVIVFGCDANANKIFDETDDAMDRACNYLSWADGVALADWAGLRPLTELEFEKACRGPKTPVANEYAWGNTTISATTAIENDGTGTETATGGNCNYNSCLVDGPYRAGIYATGSSSRLSAGASYWGIMELSGSLWERCVTVGNGAGRSFQGTHGDGLLNSSGNPTGNLDWPLYSTADGAGSRGGAWRNTSDYARGSDRTDAANVYATRYHNIGWRGGRVAPSGVGP